MPCCSDCCASRVRCSDCCTSCSDCCASRVRCSDCCTSCCNSCIDGCVSCGRSCKKGCIRCFWIIVKWFQTHILAVTFFSIGVTGIFLGSYLIEDVEWKIHCISYFTALTTCAVICMACRRGNLYYKNIDNKVMNRFKPSEKRPVSMPEPKDNEILPLLSSQHSSSFGMVESTHFNDSTPGESEDAFQSIKEPPAGFEDPKVDTSSGGHSDNRSKVSVEVHAIRESGQNSPKTASPEGTDSSSNPVGSDPQTSMTTPKLDSGIALQSVRTLPSSSGEAQRRSIPSLPDPQI